MSSSGAVVIVVGLKEPTLKVTAKLLGGKPILPVMEEGAEEPAILSEPQETVEPPLRYKAPPPVATLPPSLRLSRDSVWTRPLRFRVEFALTVTLVPPMELGERKIAEAGAGKGAGPSTRFPGTAKTPPLLPR